AGDGTRDRNVTGVQTCALPIFAPDSGAGLLFLTIPNLFDMLPGGTFFGLLFFFLVIIAGLTTGVGLVEAVVVNIAEVFKLKRQTSIYVSTIVLFLLSIPSILS